MDDQHLDTPEEALTSPLPDDVSSPAHAASERTGVPAVDRVLAEVEGVGALPVAERVVVFERAHEELRRALDAHPVHDVAGR